MPSYNTLSCILDPSWTEMSKPRAGCYVAEFELKKNITEPLTL